MKPIVFYFIILIVLSLLLYYEKDHIFYILSSSYKAGLPTPTHIKKTILAYLSDLPQQPYTLIDFGCGKGDFIDYVSTHSMINHIIGIEIDVSSFQFATQRFSSIPFITIQHIDMNEFVFPIDSPIILYMYEPLWCLPKEQALISYHNIISHLPSTCHLIYVSGIKALLDDSFFLSYHFRLLKHSIAKRILGWNGNHIYLWERR